MAKLSDYLKYFIRKKIKEDSAWRKVEVILSGHEVRRCRSNLLNR
jgi:5'-3' exoribonuclease 1